MVVISHYVAVALVVVTVLVIVGRFIGLRRKNQVRTRIHEVIFYLIIPRVDE